MLPIWVTCLLPQQGMQLIFCAASVESEDSGALQQKCPEMWGCSAGTLLGIPAHESPSKQFCLGSY